MFYFENVDFQQLTSRRPLKQHFFFQKEETDHPALRVTIQPALTTVTYVT